MRRLTILIALLVTATAADAQILKIPAPYVTASGTAGGSITFPTATGIRTGTTSGDTLLIQAYDVDGAAYTSLLTLTAGNTPTLTALFGAGSAGAPSMSFLGDPNTGFRNSSADTIGVDTAGATYVAFTANNAGGILLNSTVAVGWAPAADMTAAPDVRLYRDAAATLQLGADAEGVTNQTFKAADRITSDGVGADLILAGGRNRGASAGGSVIIQTAPAAGAGVAGTLANALVVDSTKLATFYGDSKRQGANGQTTTFGQISVLCTIATDTNCSGKGTGTITITGAGNLIPAGAVVTHVTARVTTILAGSDGIATWALGHAGDTDAWGAALALAANTTVDGANYTVTSPPIFTSATAITISGTGGKIIDSGAVRLTIHYIVASAATS